MADIEWVEQSYTSNQGSSPQANQGTSYEQRAHHHTEYKRETELVISPAQMAAARLKLRIHRIRQRRRERIVRIFFAVLGSVSIIGLFRLLY